MTKASKKDAIAWTESLGIRLKSKDKTLSNVLCLYAKQYGYKSYDDLVSAGGMTIEDQIAARRREGNMK